MHEDNYDDEGPGEHDAHLLRDDSQDLTPCPACGKYVWAYATRCHHCDAQFTGEAWSVQQQDVEGSHAYRLWLIGVVIMVASIVWWLWR